LGRKKEKKDNSQKYKGLLDGRGRTATTGIRMIREAGKVTL